MATVQITLRTIEAALRRRTAALPELPAGEDWREVVRDSEVRGLELRITRTSASWRFSYRPRGRTADGRRWPSRSIMLGLAPGLSPAEARRQALAIKAEVATGGDPAEARRQEIAQRSAERARDRSCVELLPDFARALAERDSPRGGKVGAQHVRDMTRGAEQVLAALGALDRPPSTITARGVGALFGGRRDSTSVQRLCGLRSFLDHCLGAGLVAENAARGLTPAERPKPGASRTRVLSADEIMRIWQAAEGSSPPARGLVRFLLAIPARDGEVARLRWRDIRDGYWFQDGAATKTGEPHRFLLPPLASEILDRRAAELGRRDPEALVFGSAKVPGKPLSLAHPKRALDRLSGVTGWTFHDCRRTFVSQLAEHSCSLPESALDAVLNHRQAATRSGVLAVYQVASRRGDQDTALRTWDSILRGLVSPESGGGNVLQLREAGHG